MLPTTILVLKDESVPEILGLPFVLVERASDSLVAGSAHPDYTHFHHRYHRCQHHRLIVTGSRSHHDDSLSHD